MSQARTIFERLAPREPLGHPVPARPGQRVTDSIGLLQHATGRTLPALESHERARVIWERLVRENPSVTEFQSELAESHEYIGVVQRHLGRPSEALESYEKALAIQERLARENPSVTRFQSSSGLE